MDTFKENSENFLPVQYQNDKEKKINHCYLKEQFADHDLILAKIKNLVQTEDFTLGKEVDLFENKICQLMECKNTIGVGSGTDALFLSLKTIGVGPGDEVITTPYTFYATIGAIATAGAKPVFVDIKNSDYNIDPSKIEDAITEKTKAILPVHWSGLICDMDEIKKIAEKHGLFIIEDACHAINATFNGQKAGTFGDLGCFSMHPLKNLNVWGDGGFITTNSTEFYKYLSLIRSHGLVDRDTCEEFSYNSRLDSLQAIVANHILPKIEHITDRRIENAMFLDKELSEIKQITIPKRDARKKHVFHIYVLKAENRGKLVDYLNGEGIDAKIHYPVPMHLQPAAKKYGYKLNDFPIAEKTTKEVFSLPVHEFIRTEDLELMVKAIKEFYL